ncbi:MAG: hypothetical protein WD359_00925 [Dehalococcoidia bacterium]
MALLPALNGTRALSTLMIAAFAGMALWMFVPALSSSSFGGDGSGSGTDNGALPAALKVDGEVQAASHDDVVTRLIVPLAVRGDQGIDLGADFDLRAETVMGVGASAAVPAAYAIEWLGGNGDSILDPGEKAVMTVDLPEPSSVHPGNPLRLVLKPAHGVNLVIEDVLN